MMKYFVHADDSATVQFGFDREIPDEGPPPRFPHLPEGWVRAEVSEPFSRDRPTAIPRLQDGAVVWIDPRTLDQARADKIADLSKACGEHIVAGFKSSALGAPHTYPAKLTDQTNLAGSVLDSLIPGPADWSTPFWCADADGVWEFRRHTATQIQQVGRDGKASTLAAMATNEALRRQIEAIEPSATANAEVDAITWPEE